MRGFVSGGTSARAAYPRQVQIAPLHQTLGPKDEMANLRPQDAIGVPLRAHGLRTEERDGNVAMRGARLRSIQRLQGAKMQKTPAGDRPCMRVMQRIAIEQSRQSLKLGDLATQVRGQRHGAGIGRTIG